MEEINVQKAKKIIAGKLRELGLPEYKLTAKTISFSDLARAAGIFVKIHNWKPSPAWNDLKNLARLNNFGIEA